MTLDSKFKKEYIIGINELIAVDGEDLTLTKEEKEELAFCQTTVLTASGKFIKYGWDEIISRCETLNNSGSEKVENRYYLHKDHLGSVVGISDGSGTILSEYEYDVFGNFTLSGSDIGNSILFTGREFDKEIGLYYFKARYYSAELGRFISRDPIGQNDDVNLYAYVGNNSVMFVDPSGEFANFIAGGVISVGLGIGFEALNSRMTGDPFKYGWKDAGVDFGAGAIGVGIVSGIQKIGKIGRLGKIGLELVGDTALGVGSEYIKSDCPKGKMLPHSVLSNIEQYIIAGALGNVFGKLLKGVKKIGTKYINFSQTSVNGKEYEKLLKSMKSKGYVGDSIDVVELESGNLVSIDNKRLRAAKELGIEEIPAVIHGMNDKLPMSMYGRFKKANTWGEALIERTKKQKNPKININGTSNLPELN